MKVFLVSTCSLPLLGIEKCQAFAVYPAQEAAFVRQYARYIIIPASNLVASLPIPVTIYKGH